MLTQLQNEFYIVAGLDLPFLNGFFYPGFLLDTPQLGTMMYALPLVPLLHHSHPTAAPYFQDKRSPVAAS
uniref:Uncharacterized protein n=1 Tax=Aegilops tauschii subsp. strangulata TaxID=200361 RepID=A0A452ZPT7_AEGTS